MLERSADCTSQSPARRQHLATVDFSTLDISTPSQVLDLQYAEDGRPLSRTAGKVKSWTSAVQAISGMMADKLLPGLQVAETGLTDAVTSFGEAAELDGTAAMLAAAQNLETGLYIVRTIGHILANLVDVKTEADVKEYIASLKLKLAAQAD
jgi:hypothetical protein